MPKVKITKPFRYFRQGDGASYSLKPEMGILIHLPKHVREAAIDAGAAETVKTNSRKPGEPT